MKRIIAIALLLCLLLCGCSKETTYTPTPSVHEQLKVHFIDVGQAECILLEFNKQFALIDGGNETNAETILSYLHVNGVNKLELAVATHLHADHVGGLDDIIDAIPIDTIWSSPLDSSKHARNLERSATNQGKEIQQPTVGQVFNLGQATITVIGPVKEYSEADNQSIVLMVEYGSTRFLLTSGMDSEAEKDLMASGYDLNADVLKVGQHGGENASSADFLRSVTPKYALISCSKDEPPSVDTLARLNAANATVLRTNEFGSMIVRSDGKELHLVWGEEIKS